jgi:hypothetical protein
MGDYDIGQAYRVSLFPILMSVLNNNMIFRERSYRFMLLAMIANTLFLIAALTLYVNVWKMHFLYHDYVNWKYVQDFLVEGSGEHNDFIVLGDSRVMAGYDPLAVTDIRTRNLALGGGSTIEAYFTLQRYLRSNTVDSVILSITPYHLAKLDVFWTRTVKFRFLEPAELREVLRLDAATTEPYFADRLMPMADYYSTYFPFAFRAELRNSFMQHRFSTNLALYEHNVAHRGLQFQGQNERTEGLSSDVNHKSIVPLPILDIYMEKLAKLAAENDIRLFWYTAPINTPTCNAIAEGYRDTFHHYLDSLNSRFEMTVLSGIHCMDPDNFGDRGHLNRRGATINSLAIAKSWRAASD